MLEDIQNLDLSKDTIVFRNPTTHARIVENYNAVYATARIEMANEINAAVQRASRRK
jgi:hypothetical protein